MNYLAHAYLSYGDTQLLTGNMIADHVKGQKPLLLLPEGIANGIHLHRKIDAFSDIHPAVNRAKIWFREPYRLYAGAILDTLWDHFLANDAAAFPSDEDLKSFSQRTYASLEDNSNWLPPTFANYLPHMKEHDWLFNYKNIRGIQRSLQGLERRANYIPPIKEAYDIFIGRYYQLAQCYYELIDDLQAYVKNEIVAIRG
ncbi:MAG: ACP phosphodiesterase [Chitinophagaceae bacterium]